MRNKGKLFTSFCVLTLLLSGAFSGAATAKGDMPERLDSKLISQTDFEIQSLTTLTLQESADLSNWTNVYGNLASGYTMVLDPADAYEYLDVATLNATPSLAPGDYPFKLDSARVPAGFYDMYWAPKGVTATAIAGTWQAFMWQIINGSRPMFILRVSNTGNDLIDGLAYAMAANPLLVTDPVRVNGDYPLHTYNFEGTLGTETLVVGITFTHAVTPSLTIDTAVVNPIVIDGCGYVDIVIHLSGVQNLYALDLSLAFSPAFVEVVDLLPNSDSLVNPGINLLPLTLWGSPTTAYTVSNIADNNAGTIRFVSSLLNSYAISGEVDVAKIRLQAKGLGTSFLTITGMELSDRDGYPVGVPLVSPINYDVTTQFTAASGLDLGISRVDAETVRLSWPVASLETVSSFLLHRSTTPYFTPTTGTVYQTIINTGTPVSNSFNDDDNLGITVNHSFYALQVKCSNGFISPPSQQVGKFENELHETLRTDYSWIGIVLELQGVTNTLQLAEHIQVNSNAYVQVLTVSTWNNSSQLLELSINDPDEEQQTVYTKHPYQVEINIPNVTNGNVIWDQVGRLPEITTDNYTLLETSRTDYSWILQPLDMTSITNTYALINQIQSNASGGLVARSVSIWNGSSQLFELFLPDDGGETHFGNPYQIDVDILGLSPVTWP